MSEPEQLTKLRRKLNAKTREIEALVASTYGLGDINDLDRTAFRGLEIEVETMIEEKGRPKKLALRNCKPLSGYKPAELSANKISGPRHAVGRRDTECPPASRPSRTRWRSGQLFIRLPARSLGSSGITGSAHCL